MHLTDLFIRRPVLASVISLLLLLLGLQAMASLSIRQFPKFESTTISITVDYPGASPELMRGFITTPIQQSVASAEGIDTISSRSIQGHSEIRLKLRLDADPDRAVTDVMTRVNEVKFTLPREAFDPVVTRESSNSIALAYLNFGAERMTPAQVADYLIRVVRPALQAVPGVARAHVFANNQFSMRLWLKPDRMAALGVTPGDVRDALTRNNFQSAAGDIKGNYVRASIEAGTDAISVEQFRDLVVASRPAEDGARALIRLRDVADVDLGAENAETSTFADGKPTVFMSIDTTPGANPLTVMKQVHAVLDTLRPSFPQGMTGAINYDASDYIRQSIIEVAKTVAEASLIVILVVYLFLGNVRSTLIPVITIPISLIGVLFLLQALGYSINLLTMLAMVLAIGLVVDDAIVVVENVSRHIEEGMTPLAAALQGAREIALPVIGMTLTLGAVYAPMGFLTGMTGTLFKEFAFTLAAAVILSGIIALTLSPMMCGRILRSHENDRFARWLDRHFSALCTRYARLLSGALAMRRTGIGIAALLALACPMLYVTTQSELAPEEDQGILFLLLQAPEWVNTDFIDAYVPGLIQRMESAPEYDRSFLITGNGGAQGMGGMVVKPWDQRERSTKTLMPIMQAKFNELAGLEVQVFPFPALPSESDGPPVQFVITTLQDYQSLARVADAMTDAALKSGKFIFAASSLRYDKPEVQLAIDRDKANEMGVSMEDIGQSLATLLGGNYVNLFDVEGRSYRVIPQVARTDRLEPDLIGRYHVRSASGMLVPLSTFVTARRAVQPNAVTTFQQLNSATIQGMAFPGQTQGDALKFLEKTFREIAPPGFAFDYVGESRQYKQEGGKLVYIFGFALIVIFLVLAAQFESFRDPVVILAAVPLTMFGALLPLNLGLSSINLYTQIGMLTLVGLIAKHGILMVDFANKLQASRNLDKRAAIIEAATIRLRPILMTTAAMVLGVVPLLVAGGPGGAARFALGLVISCGMLIGTLFTLFIVPVVYTYMAADHRSGPDKRPVAQG